MRTLFAFLGIGTEQLASLQSHLLAMLRIADNDKDEWVQVASGLVRRTVMPSGDARTDDGLETVSSNVLRKAVTEVLDRSDEILAERARGRGKQKAKGDAEVLSLCETPYFSPLEERFVSRKQRRPKQEFSNAHLCEKCDLLSEISDDMIVGGASHSTSPHPMEKTKRQGLQASHGGSTKPPSTSLHSSTTGPNLAQARRVSVAAAADPAAGSDGLRRTSKPLALARNHGGGQVSGGGPLFGSPKSGSSATGGRAVRAGGGAASGGKKGVMMINVDDLKALHAEKEITKERAKGRPGRKKAKVSHEDDQEGGGADKPDEAVDVDGFQQPPQPATKEAEADEECQDEKATESDAVVAKPATPEKTPMLSETAMAIPQQGEIEAMAAMMVLGVGGGEKEAVTLSLPEPLTKLLENANALKPEGKMKLESFFQKKAPEGLTQERVKYHEEVSNGAEGETMRVTSYIRLDYEKWIWDRVHKRKVVK